MDITLTDGGIETRIVYDFKHPIGDFEAYETLWLGQRPGKVDLWLPTPKNVTILVLPWLPPRLHIVCPKDSPPLLLVVDRYSQLVCAAVHQYSHLIQNLTLPHRHDSTKTRNPARVT